LGKRIAILLGLVFLTGFSHGQQQLTRILFIFDASNSMLGKWEGSTKIDRAREVFATAINDLDGIPNLELALRVYGHQSPVTPTFQDCNDTKLEVPFSANNHAAIKGFVNSVECKGTTPIANSLEAAINDFPNDNSRKIIILITDGLEACDAFPCEVAKKLKEKGIGITPFVVGLGIDLQYLNQLACVGRLYEASTLESFQKVMQSVISDAVLATSVQFDLKDIHGKPTETDVTMFLYESGTKNLKHTFMHTMNFQGNPDTITIIDPKLKYDLVVNTLPQVQKTTIEIKRGMHNHIPVDCPRGQLQFRFEGVTKNRDVQVRVCQSAQQQTLHVQKTGESQKYIVGKYDLEILTIPRIYKSGVEINQSTFTYIDIPGSGQFKYTFAKPLAAQLFVDNGNGTYLWVYDFEPGKLTGDIFLQPGNYKIVYRPQAAVSTDYSGSKTFSIQSGQNTFITI
jgi:Ca-activated chloride channel family protein